MQHAWIAVGSISQDQGSEGLSHLGVPQFLAAFDGSLSFDERHASRSRSWPKQGMSADHLHAQTSARIDVPSAQIRLVTTSKPCWAGNITVAGPVGPVPITRPSRSTQLTQGQEPCTHDAQPRDLLTVGLEIRLLFDDRISLGAFHFESVADTAKRPDAVGLNRK